jgi:hypothetical protein
LPESIAIQPSHARIERNNAKESSTTIPGRKTSNGRGEIKPMKPLTKWMLLPILATGLLLTSAHTTLAQDTSGSSDVKDTTTKAAKNVAKGTKTAADKTAEGTKTAADKTATGTKTVASKTANGTKTVAKDTAHGTKTVANKTASGTKKVFRGSSSSTGKADDSSPTKPPNQ